MLQQPEVALVADHLHISYLLDTVRRRQVHLCLNFRQVIKF